MAQTTYLESKNHYPILDGLRGVASVLVIMFHVLETFTGGNKFIQIINHGYLAVDFFFLLYAGKTFPYIHKYHLQT